MGNYARGRRGKLAFFLEEMEVHINSSSADAAHGMNLTASETNRFLTRSPRCHFDAGGAAEKSLRAPRRTDFSPVRGSK
jgi:hypothetical protein